MRSCFCLVKKGGLWKCSTSADVSFGWFGLVGRRGSRSDKVADSADVVADGWGRGKGTGELAARRLRCRIFSTSFVSSDSGLS